MHPIESTTTAAATQDTAASSTFILLSKFKNVLLGFLDELVQQFPNDPDIVMCRIFIKDQIPVQVIMDKFRETFLPRREMIVNRDPQFFTTGTREFCASIKLGSNIFEKVWTDESMDDETRLVVWEWIASLYRIVDKYEERLDNAASSSIAATPE